MILEKIEKSIDKMLTLWRIEYLKEFENLKR